MNPQVESNQLILSGTVTEVLGLRYTPGGVPHYSFMLEHRSRQEEAGVAREVLCRIKVEARGREITEHCEPLAVSDRLQVTGFLSRRNYKDSSATQLVLHAQHIELR
ncbi:primosomal replication protein N [Ketobacter sp. MCCC 1A13808]|uniref:primosomal replication protein N n=1 Tax=Ketobacter sp. MCCC 1A13808 TaxID=2602738 RepID=UPI000F1D2042|nr:primosomal replication protein N [Ketobacter sp. MCCC 1A13808]MVF11432.1 primosomal replication protein N [Ketobacter sp. MCCC 1A13808]RLP54629.1 MAG: primosomal replication protein N [Ketobacter sp.]